MANEFAPTFEFKLIYVFTGPEETHKGLLKIGYTTIKTNKSVDMLQPNCKELNNAARDRIKMYTNTAGLRYDLLHTELAVIPKACNDGTCNLECFKDHAVHDVLTNSGIKKKTIKGTTSREWFEIDLGTVLTSIEMVKKGKYNLSGERVKDFVPIVFRPEQKEAISKTLKIFKNNDRMLWNAKMRFGKTLSALEVVKQLKLEKTIIITHRPVVNDGWYEDFDKIFVKSDNFVYGSKTKGSTLSDILKAKKNIVYFASLQDLRGSETVGGKYDKNNTVFDTIWDLVIVDEAHEGTTTALGDEVIQRIVKNYQNQTKLLELSGTPFNILNRYDENIFTWDYVMEQGSKENWEKENFGDLNPYAELPQLYIYTYDLGKILGNEIYKELEDKAFNFKEFFRVWTGDVYSDYRPIPSNIEIGDFYHKDDVWSFLNLITKEDDECHYPFSTEEYRSIFKHSLWMVPGVKEAKALSKLLNNHPVFGSGAFKIVNVAGDGDEEEKYEDALSKVKNAIETAGEDGYTITLSCGRLTTGVTIPEWTAVFYLAGSFSTSASNYLQTIFRVQSPCNKDGKIKTKAYVFDFAPDRTLKMIAESVAISTKAGKKGESDEAILGRFLNYCPVISVDGTEMKKYSTKSLFQQLKRAYADRAVKNGFDDNCLYNDELLKLDDIDLEQFKMLKGIIGSSKASHKSNEININEQGFTVEEYEEIERLKKKPKKQLTPEEEAILKEAEEKRKQARDASSILRGISIRMPLLIYGAEVDFEEDITIGKLVDIVDDTSWEEFMPTGVTKEIFKGFIKYYDADIFISAGHRIRQITKNADEKLPVERIKDIANLFSNFKNPDKETVLTPWRVVNMHMGDCLGGYDFYDESFNEVIDIPRYIDQGQVTEETVSNVNAKILEINSKTGLYPLYLTYSIFKKRCEEYTKSELTEDVQNMLWKKTIEENIFIICKTKMAKSITKRTLAGFKEININSTHFIDLNNMMRNKSKQFVDRVTRPNYWKKRGDEKMEFDAVVGNPPYQENISDSKGNSSLSKQLFPIFIENAILIKSKYVSLVTPSRWFTGDAQDKSFIRLREFIRDNNFITKVFNYHDNKLLFNNVEIAGGVNYFLYEQNNDVVSVEFTECYANARSTTHRLLFEDDVDIIISMNKHVSILNKVKNSIGFNSITSITFGINAFGVIGKSSSLAKITSEKYFEDALELRCAYEQILYIKRSHITRNKELVDKWKVFTSKANGGAGVLSDEGEVAIIGKAYIGKPKTACTDTLIPLGPLDTEIEAINLQKYMTGKFLRFMIGILKVSQNICQNVYRFVPLQDFTGASDIDWSKSIKEIDQQLYKKYGLSEDEIDYIESKIREME